MDLASKYFNDIDWRYVDHSSGLAPMQSFAFDDTFSESVGKDLSCNVVRTWIHQHTVILGIHDSRLPFLKDGIKYLTDEIGYNAIVREFGWSRCSVRSRSIKYLTYFQRSNGNDN